MDQTETTDDPSALPEHVSVAAVARAADMDKRTLERWAAKGTNGAPELFDFGTAGKKMRRDDVLDWLDSRRVPRAALDTPSS